MNNQIDEVNKRYNEITSEINLLSNTYSTDNFIKGKMSLFQSYIDIWKNKLNNNIEVINILEKLRDDNVKTILNYRKIIIFLLVLVIILSILSYKLYKK